MKLSKQQKKFIQDTYKSDSWYAAEVDNEIIIYEIDWNKLTEKQLGVLKCNQ